MTPARKALAATILAVLLWAAIVVQLTVVNRLPFPGAAVPDLVLLLVTAVAVTVPPALAAATGFAGGLLLDIAPPAAHYAGEYALVFCLAAYAASRVNHAISNAAGERDPFTAFTVMAVAAAAGEAGKAALGMLLSDPDVTTAAVSRVLPGAILYDLLLAPLAFWVVARVTRGAVSWSAGQERAPALEFGSHQRFLSAFRQASVGAAPRLRLAGTGAAYGSPKNRPPASVAGRVPKLRLSDARAHSIVRTAAASSGSSQVPLAAGRTKKLNFAGDLPVRAGTRPARGPGKNWLRTAASPAVAGTRRRARGPGKNWLRTAASPAVAGTRRRARGPGKNWLRTAASPAVAGTRRPARGPGRGWLRPGAGGLAGGVTSGSTATGHSGRRAGARPRRFAGSSTGTGRPVGSPSAVSQRRTPDEALAARSAPSGMSALSGTARRTPRAGWLSGSRSASTPAIRKTPRTGWLGSARGRPRTVIGSAVRGRTVTGTGAGIRKGARRRRRAGGTWHAAFPAGGWLRRGRDPWRTHGYRPGGRLPVSPGGALDGQDRRYIARAARLLRMMGVTK